MKQLSLQALKSFHEIMRTGSATAAAARLGLKQPGVSRLIAQMEKTVGFELFYRGKGLTPTPEALLLFAEVDRAFLNIDRVNSVIKDIRTHSVGQLKIVASPGFSVGVLSDVVVSFLKKNPKVTLNVDSQSVEIAKLHVAMRDADCGFAKMPIERSDITAEKIISCETVCVLPQNHPLAKEDVLTPALLRDQPIIQLAAGTTFRLLVDSAFRKANVSPVIAVEAHAVALACTFAAKGIGIAIVNEMMARTHLRDGLVARPFRPKILHEFAFITSSQVPMNRLTQAFLDETRHYFRNLS
jgi:DNA-binding transcriptional LysR family regulator